MTDFITQLKQTLSVVPPTIFEPPPHFLASDLAEEFRAWLHWKSVAAQYLPRAVEITVETESDYDGGGGTYTRVINLTGKDAAGCHVQMSDALFDSFCECCSEWDAPEFGKTFDFTVPLSTVLPRKTYVAHLDMLRTWILALPDECFPGHDNGN
jgi:hypothetical protein